MRFFFLSISDESDSREMAQENSSGGTLSVVRLVLDDDDTYFVNEYLGKHLVNLMSVVSILEDQAKKVLVESYDVIIEINGSMI
jgi:hypothetical protein